MLTLKNIRKEYRTGDLTVEALRGIDISFRQNEFVAVLGPSGCGKTTLLNIIGGLDRYTEGELTIKGRATREFRDRDWDAYRNHSIGFVFQSYNLIPHQTVLSNVELALTLSGVSLQERRQRAIQALEQVGLGDQLKKKPAEMSGGQMQRVAIARALVNNPEIVLADEPTGALDSETSVQIMEVLKEIAKDRLVIMVTHNPDLADQYATRIVRLLDGRVIDDSDPYDGSEPEQKAIKAGSTSMSFLTALRLSLNNLMTKKGRTFMVSLAGSIGIIGIALILSVSTGVNTYIKRVEEDTLSAYPLEITQQTMDLTDTLSSLMGVSVDTNEHPDENKIYSGSRMTNMMSALWSSVTNNNLRSFKAYLEDEKNGVKDLVSGIQYGYDSALLLYREDEKGQIIQVNPSTAMEATGITSMMQMSAYSAGGFQETIMNESSRRMNVFEALLNNDELLHHQYDILAGRLPEAMDEVVIIVNSRNELTDYTLYTLGLKDQSELAGQFELLQQGVAIESEPMEFTFDELLALRFRLVTCTEFYEKRGNHWVDLRKDNPNYLRTLMQNSMEIKVVGILRPSASAVATSNGSGVGYRPELLDHLITRLNESEIIKEQLENPTIDVFTGQPFDTSEDDLMAALDRMSFSDFVKEYGSVMHWSEEVQAQLNAVSVIFTYLPKERIKQFLPNILPQNMGGSLQQNLSTLGISDIDAPSSIAIYPKSFEAKTAITSLINEYNAAADEENVIHYTDYVGLLMSSVTDIINAVSYVLIAFVAISLVVSSIMIGIITYISVLERTKEIGILRAMGASKRDITRVFTAETLIIGLVAGILGILVTWLLNFPINHIIQGLTGIDIAAVLPTKGAVILVIISVVLTVIAGLIPSRMAARKDPVAALRTE